MQRHADLRAFCQRGVNGNSRSADQKDIAGRAAGVNSVIAFRAALDVACDPHAAADGHGAVHAHAPAGSGGAISGDAAAVHDEIAALMKTHAVAKERWIVGDLAAALTVG